MAHNSGHNCNHNSKPLFDIKQSQKIIVHADELRFLKIGKMRKFEMLKRKKAEIAPTINKASGRNKQSAVQ